MNTGKPKPKRATAKPKTIAAALVEYLAGVPWCRPAGGTPLGVFGCTYTFEIATCAGPLAVSAHDGWIACRFHDVERAKANPWIAREGRLNPFSGKWNHHWDSKTPIAERIADFARTLAEILPPSETPPCPTTPQPDTPPACC